MGFTPNVRPDDLITSIWGNEVRDRSVQVFDSVAQRDAQWANPPNGAKCFTSDYGVSWTHRGGHWMPDGAWAGATIVGVALGSQAFLNMELTGRQGTPGGGFRAGDAYQIVTDLPGPVLVALDLNISGPVGMSGTYATALITLWRGGATVLEQESIASFGPGQHQSIHVQSSPWLLNVGDGIGVKAWGSQAGFSTVAQRTRLVIHRLDSPNNYMDLVTLEVSDAP